MPFFLVSFFDPDTRDPICADPRGVLKKATGIAKRQGRECFAGVEYEVQHFVNEYQDQVDKLWRSISTLKKLPRHLRKRISMT